MQQSLEYPIVEPECTLDDVDFFSVETLARPLGFLQKARREQPVLKVRSSNAQRVEYLVTSYELVSKVLTTPAVFSSDYMAILGGNTAGDQRILDVREQGFIEVSSLLTADGADHKRMRSLVSNAFIPTKIKEMEAALQLVVADLARQMENKISVDFVEEFAAKLPANVLAFLLGLSREDNENMQRWGEAIARRFSQMGNVEERIANERIILEAKKFIEELVRKRRAQPGNDLVTDLINAHEEDDSRLSDLEILATLFILFVGATETTFSTLIFAIAHLVTHADMRKQLLAQPELIPAFNDEILRYYTPVAGVWRLVASDTELGGVPLKKGTLIMVRIDSANRDPTMFENPDRFDISRRNNARHLSFSGGAHSCVGFRVAKMELNLAIRALLDVMRNPSFRMDKTDFQVVPSTHSRCIGALHLELS